MIVDECTQDEGTDQRADDADHDVADDTVAMAGDEPAGQEAGYEADQGHYQKLLQSHDLPLSSGVDVKPAVRDERELEQRRHASRRPERIAMSSGVDSHGSGRALLLEEEAEELAITLQGHPQVLGVLVAL